MSADLRRSFKQKAKQAFELPSRLRKGLADHLDGSENRPMSFDFGCLEDDRNRIFAFPVSECALPIKESDTGMKSKQRIVIQPRGTFKYQVTGKDTLRSLAAQHSTTSSELKTINRFHSDTIFEGQTTGLVLTDYRLKTTELYLIMKKTIYIPDETYSSFHVNEQNETSDTMDEKLPIILQEDVTADVESKVEVELLSYKPLQRLIYGGQDLLFTGIKPILSVTKHITPDTLQILGSSSSSSTEASSENNIQFIKVPAKYIKDKNMLSPSVSGLLLLSADFIMFDPDPCDLLVKEGGIEEFSNIIPITELGSITLIKNADSVTSDRNQIVIKETGEQLAKKFEPAAVDKPQLKIDEHRTIFEEGNELQVISNVSEKEKFSQPILKEQESTKEFAEKDMSVMMSTKTRSETSVKMQREGNKDSEVFEAALDSKVFDKKRSTSMRKERPLSIVGNLFRLGGLESSSSEVSTPTMGNKSTFGGGGSVENISSASGSRLVSRTLSSLSTYSSTLLDDVSSHLFSSTSSTPKLQAISASPSSPTPSSTTQQGERVFFLKPIDALTKKVKEQLSSSVESTGDEDDKESDVFLLLKIIPANDSNMYIDYLFAVQQDRTSTLFTFFLYWMPTTQLDQSCFDEPWFVLADRTSEIEQNYQQQQQGYNSGNVEDIEQKKKAKEWKIVSLQEVKRLLLISEIEKLPLPDLMKKSDILDQKMVKQLTFYLPPRAEGCKWDLSYSTEIHGFSLKTLLRRVGNVDGSIMIVIKDDKNQVFGSMLSCTLKPCDTFYGNGECYLFSFYRKFRKFGWSGLNNYFIYATSDSISIGSGEGAVGLWLDGDLYYGRTQQCQTYKNDLLTENQDFIVRCLEVWRFV